MKPVSVDAILAALAVLSVSGAVGCSKSAAPASETSAPAMKAASTAAESAAAQGIAAPPTPMPSAPAAAAPPAAEASAVAVDAGTELDKSHLKAPRKASASCGATGCSPDMKKGGK
jgi:hypothetical protein